MKNLHKIINETDYDMKPYQPLFDSFIPYSQKKMGYDKPVTILFLSDKNNMKNPLGKTGFYDPANSIIGVYGDGRHIKDILRSLSHELVHHTQNCRGESLEKYQTGEGYAQKNPHLRKMEEEAYLRGNMLFRDWEDNYKKEKITLRIKK
jgi:hypothetical protein